MATDGFLFLRGESDKMGPASAKALPPPPALLLTTWCDLDRWGVLGRCRKGLVEVVRRLMGAVEAWRMAEGRDAFFLTGVRVTMEVVPFFPPLLLPSIGRDGPGRCGLVEASDNTLCLLLLLAEEERREPKLPQELFMSSSSS